MMDPDSLTGRIAVVTGGGSAPGGATARVFAEVGMAVAALDIDEAVAACAASRNGEPKVRTMG
jgi:NAD(P)-dependent dehydrogenase (short-subunit alcohol dehydrogenase family)